MEAPGFPETLVCLRHDRPGSKSSIQGRFSSDALEAAIKDVLLDAPLMDPSTPAIRELTCATDSQITRSGQRMICMHNGALHVRRLESLQLAVLSALHLWFWC
ncbi:hypothetical protein VTN77DRAFT_8431 [Rasamsonia byssochlamydoides]|uniref:uncharacterized protein n=1 Tax=Rasamsonia byssochlamydoides TaxID=89139 RepID=UPI0037444FE1